MNPVQTLPLQNVRPVFRPSAPRPDSLGQVLSRVEDRRSSFLTDHGGECCRTARAWFRCMAVSAAARHPGPPAWIRQRWEWGPSEWPLPWCRIASLKTLDCGALACLARAALHYAGNSVLAVQLLERFDPGAVEHWRATWSGLPATPPWTWDSIAYHEAAGILEGDRLSIWDPTDGHFVEVSPKEGYSSVLAMRLSVPVGQACPRFGPEYGPPEEGLIHWNGRTVELNRWTRVRSPREESRSAESHGDLATLRA